MVQKKRKETINKKLTSVKKAPVKTKAVSKTKRPSMKKINDISKASFNKYLTPLLDPANHIEETIPIVLAASNKKDSAAIASVSRGMTIFTTTLNKIHKNNWFKYVVANDDPNFSYHTIEVSPKFQDKYGIPREMIINYLVCQAFSFINLLPARYENKGVNKNESS